MIIHLDIVDVDTPRCGPMKLKRICGSVLYHSFIFSKYNSLWCQTQKFLFASNGMNLIWLLSFPFLLVFVFFPIWKIQPELCIILHPDSKSLMLLLQMLMPKAFLILISNHLDKDHYHMAKLSKNQLIVLHPKYKYTLVVGVYC